MRLATLLHSLPLLLATFAQVSAQGSTFGGAVAPSACLELLSAYYDTVDVDCNPASVPALEAFGNCMLENDNGQAPRIKARNLQLAAGGYMDDCSFSVTYVAANEEERSVMSVAATQRVFAVMTALPSIRPPVPSASNSHFRGGSARRRWGTRPRSRI